MNTKLTVKIILIIVIIMIVNNINSVDNFTDINDFCSPEEIQKKYQSSDNSGVVRCYIDGIINNYKDNITKLNEFMNNVSSNDGLKLINELKIKKINSNGKYFINNDNIVNKNTIIPYLPINNNYINSNNIEELWDNNDIPYGWFPCNGKIFNLTNKNNIEKFGQSVITPDLSNRFIKCNTGNDIGGEKNVKLTSIPNHSHSLNIGQHNYNKKERLLSGKRTFLSNSGDNVDISIQFDDGEVDGHNNMPPFYTVIFIGKFNE
jgi:hypothetical protein